jgi:hypothetical protein
MFPINDPREEEQSFFLAELSPIDFRACQEVAFCYSGIPDQRPRKTVDDDNPEKILMD